MPAIRDVASRWWPERFEVWPGEVPALPRKSDSPFKPMKNVALIEQASAAAERLRIGLTRLLAWLLAQICWGLWACRLRRLGCAWDAIPCQRLVAGETQTLVKRCAWFHEHARLG